MKKEIWKSVVGYEGIYEVSSLGGVRTVDGKTTNSIWHGERVWKQRILKQKISNDNNCRVELWKEKINKTWLVHRLVAKSFIKREAGRNYVNHIDGDRLNNSVDNLEWVTSKENSNHAFEHGLMPTNKFIILENLITGELKRFNSMSNANRYLGYSNGFINSLLKKDIHIVDHYAIYTTKMDNSHRVEFINDRIDNLNER